MDFQKQSFSFGDFETGLDPEHQREVYKILYEKSDDADKKVEFPWSSTDTDDYNAAQGVVPGQLVSAENSWSSGPQFVGQLMPHQSNPYGHSMSNDPNTSVSHQFQMQNDFFYDHTKGDNSDFYGQEQTSGRDQDDKVTRGSKPYERRNKKKRPPEYYKKVEEEIQAEILAKETLSGAPRGMIWNRGYGPDTPTDQTHQTTHHKVPSTSQHDQLYQLPTQTPHTSSSQYTQNYDQGAGESRGTSSAPINTGGTPMGASGAPPSQYIYGQNRMQGVSHMGSYSEYPHEGSMKHHAQSGLTREKVVYGVTQPIQKEGQNVTSDDSVYKYSSPPHTSVSSNYSNQGPVSEKHTTETTVLSQQLTDLRVSQNESVPAYPHENKQDNVCSRPVIPSHPPVGAQVPSAEKNPHNIQENAILTCGDTDNTGTNYSKMNSIETDNQSKESPRDLDLDQYPALGKSANTEQYPTLVQRETTPGQTASSSTVPSSEYRASSDVKQTNVQSQTSASQSDMPKPKTSSWAGLFRDVNPAKQGFVVTYGGPKDKVEDTKPAASAVTREERPVELVSPADDPAAKQLGDALGMYKISHNQVGLQMRGLINRGNWCYINATLQALVSCPPFYNLMKKIPAFLSSRRGQSSTPILDSIVEFVNEFTPCGRTTDKGRKVPTELPQGSTFEPVNVYKMLQVMEANPSFKLGKQEDAEEFLSSILDGMHEEMAALIKLASGKTDGTQVPGANGFLQNDASVDESSEDADPDSWEQVGPKKKSVLTRKANFEKTPLADIFVGYTRSAVYKALSKESATLQPFFTLQLDIQPEKVYTVKEALEGLVSKEAVIGYTCSKTKTEVDVVHRVTLEELPPVLILHLKCFVYDKDGGSQKLMKKIDYNIDLEITKDLLSASVKNKLQMHQRSYKLFAVVYHHGKQSTGGHYTTAVFHPAINNWILIDDSTVKRVGVQQVVKYAPPRVPYLLYYRRLDIN